MGALEVRAKSNLYELPKKEANRILSKCDKQTGSRKLPFPRAYPQIVGVISNFVKCHRTGTPRRQPGQATLLIAVILSKKLRSLRASLAVAKPASRAPKTAME